MRFTFFLIVALIFHIDSLLAVSVNGNLSTGISPDNAIIRNPGGFTLVQVLSFIEGFLLRVALPLVIIGTSIYIAYELFLAEGDEEKNKKAWKSVTFAAIGVICISLAYGFVSIISRLSV